MPEWLNGAVSKTVVGLVVYRGFESLSLLFSVGLRDGFEPSHLMAWPRLRHGQFESLSLLFQRLPAGDHPVPFYGVLRKLRYRYSNGELYESQGSKRLYGFGRGSGRACRCACHG